MIAHFYLMAESFNNDLKSPISEIETKTKRLAEAVILINQYKITNKLYTNYTALFPQLFYSPYTIENIICSPLECKKTIDRDVINALQNILQKSEATELTSEEVAQMILCKTSSTDCYGFIMFHRISIPIDSVQLIYSIDEWYKFRRYYLSIYPDTCDHFIDECNIYFQNLYFHERNKKTISSVLSDCPKKIIYHLSALNDDFRTIETQGHNRTETLKRFSIASHLDEVASLEGDITRKTALTFSFINQAMKYEDVCCEPHLKLCYNDLYPGDSSYSTERRIYFHEGKPNIHNGKILIGHIGKHL